MPTYDTPGVYIEEQTGPGVIAGVGTSTAALIGPARRGPILEPVRISSYEEFLSLYAAPNLDGSFDPFITSPRRFFLAQAVRGFFINGGREAYIVRAGTARATAWDVDNRDGKVAFRVQAREPGAAGDNVTVAVQAAHATGDPGPAMATGSATAQTVSGITVTLAAGPNPFRAGDVVAKDLTPQTLDRAAITAIAGQVLTLSSPIAGLVNGDTLRIAHLIPAQPAIRMAATTGLSAGAVVHIRGRNAADSADVDDYAIVESVDAAGFVTFASAPARANTFNLAVAGAPTLTSEEFHLLVTPPGSPAQSFDNLSLEAAHPGYVFAAVGSESVEILPPPAPPTTPGFPGRLINPVAGNLPITVHGRDDDPGAIALADFQAGLDALRNVDEVNILCIPDAADHPDSLSIQQAMIQHCVGLKNRFAILDSHRGAPLSGAGSVEEQRAGVQSPNGFAALYYPWLEVRDPLSAVLPPRTMLIPPSGHMAGIYARTDGERGVHKAPANTDVRGALGLERRLSDGQQGPLNLEGINVLRIFQGSSTIVVWGARTTVDPHVTDWIYVPVRRLLTYIELSISEGIRFAVFEPNNLALWQKLKRTIGEFLTRVWRDGALFGDSADKAFYVRIDEALNPPAVRALGRLYIEIGVAAVRPAEFIIVRIGLWDGGAAVSEG
jgi:phage tail sheath protein FI